MSTTRIRSLVSVALIPFIFILSSLALPFQARQGLSGAPLPVAPVPADPHELVNGPATVPATPDERAAALALLDRARQNGDMRIAGAAPFVLNARFTAGGNVAFTGAGELTETWLNGPNWRWTANLGDYSQARNAVNSHISDEQRVEQVPMRVQMLRAAIFNPVHDVSPDFGIRVATAQKDGEKLTCVLIGEDGGNFPAGHPRFWQEREYCVANGSGLLRVYSEAPGVYVEYGYGSGLQFHGRAAPDRIIVYAGGAPVLDAQISIADAGQAESIPANRPGEPPVTLGPASMTAIDAQSGLASPEIQPVVVHATISPRGSLLESEVVAASAPALAPLALQVVKNSRFSPSESTQRELYILVRFEPAK